MKKCNFHVRGIKSIRPYITKRVCHSLIIALVVSNLDYCNALQLEIPRFTVSRKGAQVCQLYSGTQRPALTVRTGTCLIQGLGSGPQGCQQLWANIYVRPCLAPQAYQVLVRLEQDATSGTRTFWRPLQTCGTTCQCHCVN